MPHAADCWAYELGGCDGKLSREHLVTDGLWTGPQIEVVGFPWCRDKPLMIGRANIVAKILCRKHNSALSDVDSAGIHAFRTLQAAAELQERRRKYFHPPLVQQCFHIEGLPLERWFLKTAINLALVQQGELRWADGSSGRTPPKSLVRAAFGEESLGSGLGLYAAAQIGEAGLSGESVHFAPLFDAGDCFVGSIFSFRGFRFLLSLRPGSLPPRISLGNDTESPWYASHLLHHIERFRFTLASQLSHFVYLTWPERLTAHYFDRDTFAPAP
jgi:hypothetical protein